jgi:hypothetical protein
MDGLSKKIKSKPRGICDGGLEKDRSMKREKKRRREEKLS